jgi:hypothetical protein
MHGLDLAKVTEIIIFLSPSDFGTPIFYFQDFRNLSFTKGFMKQTLYFVGV